ncbi:MAG: TIGR02647 family protein [Spongiibacteraceae bacterium]
MPYTTDITDELNLLARYNLDTTQEGIKVHSNADKAIIDATQRLFDKGLLSQSDGGYLTNLGREAAEHAQATLHLLKV